NAIGNITKQTTNRNGYDSYVQNYTYDALNRLTEWQEGKFNIDELYTYDKIGNRTTHEINGIERFYSYTPGTNRLGNFEYEINSIPYNTEYTYNNIGQMLTRLKHVNSILNS